MNLKEAIQIAIVEVKDEYAQVHLNAIDLSIEYGIRGLKTQLLYALSNMKYWKGPKAREVKKVFNDFIKSKD